MYRRATLLLFAAVLIGGAGAPVIAWAHPGSSPASADSGTRLAWISAQPAPVHALILLVAAIVFAGWLISRRRRGDGLALVGISLVFTLVGFEAAIHSVHHVGDPQGADRCPVASSADHVSAVELDVPTIVGLATRIPDAVVPSPLAVAPAASLAPAAGRAPPA